MSQQIRMVDENILVQKVEDKIESQFEMAGDADRQGAVYKVCHAPSESFEVGQSVLLKPGTYPGIFYDGEMYTVIEESDVIAIITEEE